MKDFFFYLKKAIRIANPYGAYGLLIRKAFSQKNHGADNHGREEA